MLYRISFVVHTTLQLTIGDVVKKCAAVKSIIEKSRAITSAYKNSSSLQTVFENFQSQQNNENPESKLPSLQKDVVTRWNSSHTMMVSILKNRQVICRASQELGREDLNFTEEEWECRQS